MKLLLLSAYHEPQPDFVPSWLRLHSDPSPHILTDDPSEADLIVFAETFNSLDPYFIDVIRHPVYRAHAAKCILYHISDTVHTLCRTLSPSVERCQPNPRCRRSFHYIARRKDNELLGREYPAPNNPKYLFSFIGARETHPVRSRILRLHHPQCLLEDTTGTNMDALAPCEKRAFHNRFVQSVLDSHFILCPRGFGPTSMRLFEVMQLGRAPVVVGDSWKPVQGVDWSSFSIFVPENQVESIPAILESHRDQAMIMGRAAKQVWMEKFAPNHAIREIAKAGTELLKANYGLEQTLRDCVPLLHPKHWRRLAGYFRREWRGLLPGGLKWPDAARFPRQ